MSYINSIPADKLNDYEIIDDWPAYFEKEVARETAWPNLPVQSLTIKNKIINSEVAFWGGTYSFGFRFEHCYFKQSIAIAGGKFEKEFAISNCFIDDSFSAFIGDIHFGEGLSIFSTLIKKSFLVANGIYKKYCLWHIGDTEKCMLVGGTFDKLNFSVYEKPIQEFNLGGKDLEGLITINGEDGLTKLKLSYPAKALYLSLENVVSNNVEISNYRNDGSFRMSNITPSGMDSEFSITHSYLGKAEFYSVALNKFSRVNILDSYLADCIFVSTVFPENIFALTGRFAEASKEEAVLKANVSQIENHPIFKRRSEQISSEVVFTYYKRKRETLRQIKYAYGKQGDVVNEQKFHALEMKALDRSLTFKTALWTKLVIRASSWTSSFGQSVARPLFFLLIGHWVLFILLIAFHNFKTLSLSLIDYNMEGFKIAFEKYFQLINPLRRNEVPFRGYLVIIDLLMRIWASYMIYNIIRASRRFIK